MHKVLERVDSLRPATIDLKRGHAGVAMEAE